LMTLLLERLLGVLALHGLAWWMCCSEKLDEARELIWLVST
jgi:hypothetical protein